MKLRHKIALAGTVLTGVLGLAALPYLFKSWDVRGNAMAPTLPNGAFVISRRVLGSVSRGDVIIVTSAPDGTPTLMTRVIGLAGDTVVFRGSDILLNGLKLRHDAPSSDGTVYETLDGAKYAVSLGGRALGPDRSVLVPSGHVFVMADNRGEARDSRTFGPVSLDQVDYKVLFRLPSRR